MQKSAAEVDKDMFDAWQNVVNDPAIRPEQRVNELLKRQEGIIDKHDKRLDNQLQQLKSNPGKQFRPDAVLFEDDLGGRFLVPKDSVIQAQQDARNKGINIRIVQ